MKPGEYFIHYVVHSDEQKIDEGFLVFLLEKTNPAADVLTVVRDNIATEFGYDKSKVIITQVNRL